MIEEFHSLKKEHLISLIVAFCFLGLCFVFPIRGESFLEAVTVFATFLFIVPTLYTRYVLNRDLTELFHKPFSRKVNYFFMAAATMFGVIFMTALYFTPFMDNYKDFTIPFFSAFKSFVMYELLYLLPLLALSVYFSTIFVAALHLPKMITILISTIFLNTIFIALFSFPFYSTLIFFGGIIYIHMRFKAFHPLSVFVALWIPILTLDTIIAKSLSL